VVTTGPQTFAGAKTFSGSVVLSAALTIPGTVANPLTVNTKAYSFPAAFGTAGTVLTDAAGTGVLSWAAPVLSPNNLIEFTEDFMTAVGFGGAYTVVQTGTGAAWSIINSENNHWGITHFTTGTTAAGHGGLNIHNGCSILGTTNAVFEAAIRFQQTGTAGTQQSSLIIGWMDGVTGAPPLNGVYFVLDMDGTPQFFRARSTGGAQLSVFTSVFPTANTWYYLRIEYTAATNNLEYFVNNVSVGSINPNTTVTHFGPGMQLTKTVGTTAHTVDCDYLSTRMYMPSGR